MIDGSISISIAKWSTALHLIEHTHVPSSIIGK